LGDLNFWDPQFLISQIGWWLEVIKARKSRLVIADFAPCAQLAARIAGIPSVSVGTGYSVPPSGLDRFPVLLPEYEELVFAEAELLEAVNKALVHFGGERLARLSDIYADASAMPRTIAGLDPYRGMRLAPLLPPLNETLPRPDRGGDEICLYFSTSETESQALVDALTGLGLPMRAFLPGAATEIKERLAGAGVAVEQSPVPFEEINRRSRLLLHSGQHGTLCMGLGMGLGQVAFPQHLEHLFHARCAAELAPVSIVGPSVKSAEEISVLISGAYDRGGGGQAAAEGLRPDLFGDIGAITRGRILPLIQ
jgi:UDP:flavonoid glycosyltransferase YjiC (YdhE family)